MQIVFEMLMTALFVHLWSCVVLIVRAMHYKTDLKIPSASKVLLLLPGTLAVAFINNCLFPASNPP